MAVKNIRVSKKKVDVVPKDGTMAQEEFDRRMRFVGMKPDCKTAQSVRLVLVKGMNRADAARFVGVNICVVSRGVQKLKEVLPECVKCPNCGAKVKI